MSALTPDRDQTGARTQQRFDYQDACTAYQVIDRLRAKDLRGIYVELSADLILIPASGRPEMISIKTREPNQRDNPGWGWSQLGKSGVLRHLYHLWEEADRAVTTTVLSDAGLTGEACRLLDWHRPGGQDPGVLKRVAGQIDAEPDVAAEFLSAFTWPRGPLPRRSEINEVLFGRLRTLLLERGWSIRDVDQPLVDFIARIRRARQADPAAHPRYATIHTSATREDDLIRSARYISAEEVLRILTQDGSKEPTCKVHTRSNTLSSFIGRTEELKRLRQLIVDTEPGKMNPIVLHGEPGLGKTSLALECSRFVDGDHSVYFLDVTSQITLSADLRRVGIDDISTPGEARTPITLPGSTGDLVILDNLSDQSIVDRVLAGHSAVAVLITSISDDFGSGCRYLKLAEWSDEECAEFIETEWNAVSDKDRRALRERFGGNPLGWVQAADAARLLGVNPEKYLERLDAAPLVVLDTGRADRYPSTLLRAVRITIDAVAEASPEAVHILRLLSHLGIARLEESSLDSVRLVCGLPGKDLFDGECDVAEESFVIARLCGRDTRLLRLMTLARASLLRMDNGSVLVSPTIQLVARATTQTPRPYLEVAIGMLVGPYTTHPTGSQLDAAGAAPAVLSVLDMCSQVDAVGPAYYTTSLYYGQWIAENGMSAEAWKYSVEAYCWLTRTAQTHPPGHLAAFILAHIKTGVSTGNLSECLGDLHNATSVTFREYTAGRVPFAMVVDAVELLSIASVVLSDRDVAENCLSAVNYAESLGGDPSTSLQARLRLAQARSLATLGMMEDAATVTEEAGVLAAQCSNLRIESEVLQLQAGLARFIDPARAGEMAISGLDKFRSTLSPAAARGVGLVNTLIGVADRCIETNTSEMLGRAEGYLAEADLLIAEHHTEDVILRASHDVIMGRLLLHQSQVCDSKLSMARMLRRSDEFFERGIEGMQSQAPSERRRSTAALVNHAWVLYGLGRRPDAIASAQEAYRLDLEAFGDEAHPEVLHTRRVLDLLGGAENR